MLKAWYLSLLTAVGLAAVGFATNLATARGLGPEGRGLIASVNLIVTLASGTAQLGLGSAFVYLFRSDNAWPAARFLRITLVTTTAVSMGLGVIGVKLSGRFPSIIVLPVIVSCAVYSAHTFTVAIVQVERNLVLYNITRLAFPAMTFIAILVIWLEGKLTVKSVVMFQVLTGLLVVTYVNIYLKRKKIYQRATVTSTNQSESLKRYLSLGTKYHLTVMLGLVLNNIDKVYFLMQGGEREFGLYSVAYGTSRLIGTLQETISTALFSTFAGGRSENMQGAIAMSFRMTFIPLLIGVCFVSTFSEPLIRIAFGVKFQGAAIPFSILLFESVIGSAGWMLAQQFNAMGRPGAVLVRQIAAVAPLLLILPFVPTTGLSIWLACLLLASSVIRLVTTLAMYKLILRQALSELLPRKSDFVSAGTMILGRIK